MGNEKRGKKQPKEKLNAEMSRGVGREKRFKIFSFKTPKNEIT